MQLILFQALYLCENPPSFEEVTDLKERFPIIDESYKPIYKKPLPKEGYGDDACVGRVRKTIEEIMKRYKDKHDGQLVPALSSEKNSR